MADAGSALLPQARLDRWFGTQDLESSFSANRTWGPLFYRETALLAARTWCFGARTGVRGGVRRGRAMGAGDRAGWIIDQAHVS